MNMKQCPVCASPRTSSGAGCPVCDFPFAFVETFASPAAKRRWEEEADRLRMNRRAAQAVVRSGFAILEGQAACIENGVLRRFGVSEIADTPNAVQISQSRTHTLILLADGSVIAEGSNRMGQCMVQNIKNAAFVLAGPNVSYIVTRDGNVRICGVSPVAQEVSEWRDISALACGDYFVAGLTREGRVRIAAAGPEVFSPQPEWNNIQAIAAGADYLMALDKNGRVLLAGSAGDERCGSVARWENIAAIAAEDMYAVALGKDGRVLIAGEGGWLDRGRSEAGNWTNMTAIAAGHGAIAAVDESGRLRIAGSLFATAAGREAIIAQWGKQR